MKPSPSPGSSKTKGFTLIELLVVVAIIALLISILLPSLGKARQLARTVKCAAQIHSINLAMVMYGSEYNQAIVGNAQSSGAFLLGPLYSDGFCPNICQVWDWSSPVANYMNIKFNTAGDAPSRLQRYQQLASAPEFLCPENDILAVPYNSVIGQKGPSQMISYNTACLFQCSWSLAGPMWLNFSYDDAKFPGYRPKINLVGNPSSKVFIADGGRWSNGDTPNVEFTYKGYTSVSGGEYGDYGPWDGYTRSYYNAPGASGVSYSLRHGNRTPSTTLSSFKFNLGFFDGHAETRNGLDGADPGIWTPTGATMTTSSCNPPADVAARYFTSGTFTSP